MANIVNLSPPLPAGDDYTITVTCLRADNITPINLIGATAFFTVKSDELPTTPRLINRDVTTGISFPSSLNNNVLLVTGAQSDTVNLIPKDDYKYDVVIIEAGSSRRTTVVKGNFPVSAHSRPSG